MKWIGLTGGIGCGKSTVAEMLAKRGVPVRSADQIVHTLLKPTTPTFEKIVQAFGQEVVSEDGNLDRRALGRIVFSEAVKLRQLEGILHPDVRKITQQWRRELEAKNEALAVYDVPLLFEQKMQKDFDAIIVVTCSPKNQMARLKARNNWSDDEIQNRLAVQVPLKHKEEGADYLIRNDGSIEELRKQVDNVLAQIRS